VRREIRGATPRDQSMIGLDILVSRPTHAVYLGATPWDQA
jgi:hypothetical protein